MNARWRPLRAIADLTARNQALAAELDTAKADLKTAEEDLTAVQDELNARVDLFIAIKDELFDAGAPSGVLGVFSDEELARDACQDEADDDNADAGADPVTLKWVNDEDMAETDTPLGVVRYTVRLVILDEATFC